MTITETQLPISLYLMAVERSAPVLRNKGLYGALIKGTWGSSETLEKLGRELGYIELGDTCETSPIFAFFGFREETEADSTKT